MRDQAKATQAEIGWAFDPRHQGQGFATEAVRELLRACFEDLGVRRVVALAFADNVPSLRVMERLGMRREALNVKESLHRELGWLDGVTYALLAEEWLSSPRIALTVASAAAAASYPLSSTDPSSPARSSACCSVSQVSRPNPTGTPWSSATRPRPSVAALQT